MKSKSRKRIEFIERITYALTHHDVYSVIDHMNVSESKIKTYIHPYLIKELSYYYVDEGVDKEKAAKKAHEILLWEGDKRDVISNVKIFGVSHRPDMVVNSGDITVAIEVKRGSRGKDIREGVSQAMFYSIAFDFTILLFVDTNKDKRIQKSITKQRESDFLMKLWENHNIRVEVM